MRYDTLGRAKRKARKEHRCCYCDGIIKKGEIYNWSRHIYDGDIYDWKVHEKCDFIAGELWIYIDPDEVMDADCFFEGCTDFCGAFVCPECPKWHKEYEKCDDDEVYCPDRIYDFLQENELYYAGMNGYLKVWKCRKREKKITEAV